MYKSSSIRLCCQSRLCWIVTITSSIIFTCNSPINNMTSPSTAPETATSKTPSPKSFKEDTRGVCEAIYLSISEIAQKYKEGDKHRMALDEAFMKLMLAKSRDWAVLIYKREKSLAVAIVESATNQISQAGEETRLPIQTVLDKSANKITLFFF